MFTNIGARASSCSSTTPTGNWRAKKNTSCRTTTTFYSYRRSTVANGFGCLLRVPVKRKELKKIVINRNQDGCLSRFLPLDRSNFSSATGLVRRRGVAKMQLSPGLDVSLWSLKSETRHRPPPSRPAGEDTGTSNQSQLARGPCLRSNKRAAPKISAGHVRQQACRHSPPVDLRLSLSFAKLRALPTLLHQQAVRMASTVSEKYRTIRQQSGSLWKKASTVHPNVLLDGRP